MAAALAWRLGIPGFDESWAEPLDGRAERRVRGGSGSPATSTGPCNYLAPWVGKGIRGLPARLGVERKRPIPTIVPKSRERVD